MKFFRWVYRYFKYYKKDKYVSDSWLQNRKRIKENLDNN